MPYFKSCLDGKLHKTPFPSGGRKQAEVPLGLVHSNVCGSLGAELLSGERYFLTFVDDKTHYTWVYVLKFSVNSWSGDVTKCYRRYDLI